MELGEVYKQDGQISLDKLFYFHFRMIPNKMFYSDVDGAEFTHFIGLKNQSSIKEEKSEWCFVLDKNMNQLVEKTIVFHSKEIITGNGYCFTYYYGDKRTFDDDYLSGLARKYLNAWP